MVILEIVDFTEMPSSNNVSGTAPFQNYLKQFAYLIGQDGKPSQVFHIRACCPRDSYGLLAD